MIVVLFVTAAPIMALAAPSQSNTDYQKGFDSGKKLAQKDQPNCGTNGSCYGDYSMMDCLDTITIPLYTIATPLYNGSNSNNPIAYCHGFVKGYYDTAGFPQFDIDGR
jgi:hypothetical protein